MFAAARSDRRGMSRLELFVSGKLIKPFISNDLYERVRSPPNWGRSASELVSSGCALLCALMLDAPLSMRIIIRI